MEDFYNKVDVALLAEKLFVQDMHDPETKHIPADALINAAFFAAEMFYDTAEKYHRGEFGRASKSDELEKERRQTEDRRKGDRRTEAKGCMCSVCAEQTSSEEDEAFARMEKALRQHFQTAVIGIAKGNAS